MTNDEVFAEIERNVAIVEQGVKNAAVVISDLLKAVEDARKVGCIEHLDCWDDADEKWYGPIERARQFLGAPLNDLKNSRK